MRVVIDTSLWIDYNRGAVNSEERSRIEQLWREGRAILYQFVWLELLAGYRSPKEQRTLRDFRELSRWEPIAGEDGIKAEAFAQILRKQGNALGASDLLRGGAEEHRDHRAGTALRKLGTDG